MQSLTAQELERWVDFGARWRAISVDDSLAVIDMCQCTGELVERREGSEPALIEYVRTHAEDSEE